MRFILISVTLLALITGCSTARLEWSWAGDPKTQMAERQRKFYKDKSECLSMAFASVSVPTNTYRQPSQNGSFAENFAAGYENSRASSETNAATEARDEIFKGCMQGRAWDPVIIQN